MRRVSGTQGPDRRSRSSRATLGADDSGTVARPAAARRRRDRRLGLFEPSGRAPHRRTGGSSLSRLRQIVAPDGDLTDERAELRLADPRPRCARGRGRGGRAAARRAPRDRRDRYRTSAPPSSSWRQRHEHAPAPHALSGPDEHLRRPRQHPLLAAPLRVARASASSTRAPVRATGSTPPPTTSSTSAAARTATRSSSRPTWSRRSARGSPRRSSDGAVAARRLRRLPATRPLLPARRRADRRASASPISRPCARRARG